MTIRVDEAPFDPGRLLADFATERAATGGIATFLGLVRNSHADQPILALTLEHYPGMTEKRLAALEAEACRRWALQDSLIVHRVGRMLPGEAIVFVATAAAHRQAALDACAFLIDHLKTDAPFWKYEETPAGGHWVEAKESDSASLDRWR